MGFSIRRRGLSFGGQWRQAMRPVGLAWLALLAFEMPAAARAQEPGIVVRGDARRIAIERILGADNLDMSRLSPREVADAMAVIERGRAPHDFWLAYRAHALAWSRFAAAPAHSGEAARADQAIEASFDEVERIARSYGAGLPPPRWKPAPAR